MVRRQPASIRIQRQTARIPTQTSPLHEGTALALLAETQVLQADQHRDRERVVDHGDVDIRRRQPRLAERLRPRQLRRAARDVAVAGEVTRRLPGAENPYRWLTRAARDIAAGDDHRAAAVRDHAAVE